MIFLPDSCDLLIFGGISSLKQPMLTLLIVAIIISVQSLRWNVAGCVYLRGKKKELN